MIKKLPYPIAILLYWLGIGKTFYWDRWYHKFYRHFRFVRVLVWKYASKHGNLSKRITP